MNVILWDNSYLGDVNWDTIMDDHARVSGNNKRDCVYYMDRVHWTPGIIQEGHSSDVA